MDHDLLVLLITQMSPYLALMGALVWVSTIVLIAIWLNVKPNKLSHRETMAKLQNDHEERNLQINRSAPKQIEQAPPNRRNAGFGD